MSDEFDYSSGNDFVFSTVRFKQITFYGNSICFKRQRINVSMFTDRYFKYGNRNKKEIINRNIWCRMRNIWCTDDERRQREVLFFRKLIYRLWSCVAYLLKQLSINRYAIISLRNVTKLQTTGHPQMYLSENLINLNAWSRN